jgi:hypothetical protein
MDIIPMQAGSASTMQWEGFYNIILAHANVQDHSKSNTSTKVQTDVHEQGVVQAAPVEEDKVPDLVVAEELVAALLQPQLQPLPTPN